MEQSKTTRGFTLIDLMISILIGSILLVGIAQLLGISRHMFAQISGISDLFTTGYEAIQYLRVNISNAGGGLIFPSQAYDPRADLSPANCAGYCGYGGAVGVGPVGTLPGWKYLGYYYDCGSGSGSTNYWRLGAPNMYSSKSPIFTASGGTTPGNCVNAATAYNYNTSNPDNGIYFAGVECDNQCILSDPNYDPTELLTRVVPYATDLYSPCNGSNACFGNGNCGYAQTCTVDQGHNCGGVCRVAVYERLIPHVSVTTNTNGMGDQLSIIFAVRDGNNNISDCLGSFQNPAANPITPVPILVQNKFQVAISATTGLPTLQCQRIVQTNGVWGNASAWTDIMPNIEYFRVMLGMNDNTDLWVSNFSNSSVNRYVSTPIPNATYTNGAWANLTADPNRIMSIRLALVGRSAEALLPVAKKPTLTLFPATTIAPLTPVTYTPSTADQLQRKVFTTTVFLEGFLVTAYQPHCVAASGGSGQYYIKMGGIPWLGSAVSSDSCCGNGGSCYYYSSFNSCETAVSNQPCQSVNQPH